MQLSIFFVCAVTGTAIWVAVSYFQYLLEPVRAFYYCIVPILYVVLLTSSKRLNFLDSRIHYESDVAAVSKTKYFFGLVLLQTLFYIMTFWIFSCYVYQTNVNVYLHTLDILDFIALFKQYPLLYTVLPFIATACYGIGLLYFVVHHEKSPFLTECFYHVPKKLPWLFIHNVMIAAESYSYIIISYLIFIFLVLIANNSMSLLIVNFAPLSNPLLYIVIVLPVFFLLHNYNREVAGWFIRKKYSIGFAFMLVAVVFFLALTVIDVFFAPFLAAITNKNIVKYALAEKTFEALLPKRFELLLLGWFFINMPRLGSIIGRFSYGFTIREAMILNLLATALVGSVLNTVTVETWQALYTFFVDPFCLFYGTLFIILLLWLNGCYVKDQSSLWAGPMSIFPTIHLKRRSNIGFVYRSFLLLLMVLGGAGFMGWRLGQYFVTFILIFLFPIYLYFSFVLFRQLISDVPHKSHCEHRIASLPLS